EAIYRLGLRLRRDRRFADAADCWRRLLEIKVEERRPRLRPDSANASSRPRRSPSGEGGQGYGGQGSELLVPLRQFAVEALAVHHEHRERDYEGAKELTLRLLDECDEGCSRVKTEATKHRLTRLERKIAR